MHEPLHKADQDIRIQRAQEDLPGRRPVIPSGVYVAFKVEIGTKDSAYEFDSKWGQFWGQLLQLLTFIFHRINSFELLSVVVSATSYFTLKPAK